MTIRLHFLTRLLALAALAFFLGILPVGAAGRAELPGRVAFLPFEAHAAKDLGYLTSGIRDMLASRLASGAKIQVVDRASVDQALAKAGKPAQPADFKKIGEQLRADYVVAGSLTAFGAGMSLDAKVYAVASDAMPRSFPATAASENEIITAIDQLAWDIGATVFGAQKPGGAAPAVAPAAPLAGQAQYQTAHPERAFLGQGGGLYGQSPFIRPMGVAGALGFTKSQNLSLGLRAMDSGDVDGDGQVDFVLAGPNQVEIYRREQNRFVKIGEAGTLSRYVIHYITLADLNNNGRAEIYVSAADNEEPRSMALEWDGKQFAPLFTDAGWYIRAVALPGEGMVLVGQKSGIKSFLAAGVFRLNTGADGKPEKGELVDLPRGVNIFDFTYVDVDADSIPEIVAISQDDRLVVMTRNGKTLWVSDEYYGGTTRFLGGVNYEDREAHHTHYVQDVRIYVPARIVARDINQDGQLDIIVNRNISTASRLFEKLRSFPSGEMHALTWNGIAMTELWRTRKIDGYIADYQVGPEMPLPADEKNTGNRRGSELFVGVVLRSGGLDILADSTSTVLSYRVEHVQSEAKE